MAALQALNILFTQICVAQMNLSLFHTIKAAEPLWTALFSLFGMNEKTTSPLPEFSLPRQNCPQASRDHFWANELKNSVNKYARRGYINVTC